VATLESLTRGSTDERWAAARDAARNPAAVAPLAAALRNEADARVREAMFLSLARIGNAASVEAAIALLRSDDANLRTGALDALRLMTEAVRAELPRLLRDTDVDMRILSCELARGLPGTEATSLLGSLITAEENENVCAAAIDVLAEVGNPTALPALATCAHRFRESPFLAFSIQVAADRIKAQSAQSRG
jgi:HEAT repeat protein